MFKLIRNIFEDRVHTGNSPLIPTADIRFFQSALLQWKKGEYGAENGIARLRQNYGV
jgi:hypothetical protein